jgi:hypothetical protein
MKRLGHPLHSAEENEAQVPEKEQEGFSRMTGYQTFLRNHDALQT